MRYSFVLILAVALIATMVSCNRNAKPEPAVYEEIASRLGISVGTSKSNLAKAKMRLKQMFIDKYGENE